LRVTTHRGSPVGFFVTPMPRLERRCTAHARVVVESSAVGAAASGIRRFTRDLPRGMLLAQMRNLTSRFLLALGLAAACGCSEPATPTGPSPGPEVGKPDPAAPVKPAVPEVPAAKETAADHPDLVVETLVEGTGPALPPGAVGAWRYVGVLLDGTEFDSTIGKEPMKRKLEELVKGWQLGLAGIKVGEKRRLVIPPSLGYGSQQTGAIPADSTLVFTVELVEIPDS
jgi:hypothetical protein